MHDIKEIRKDPDLFAKKISERNINIDIKKIVNLDKKNRELIQTREKFEQEKKLISKKKDKSKFEKSKKLSLKIEKLINEQSETKVIQQVTELNPMLPLSAAGVEDDSLKEEAEISSRQSVS